MKNLAKRRDDYRQKWGLWLPLPPTLGGEKPVRTQEENVAKDIFTTERRLSPEAETLLRGLIDEVTKYESLLAKLKGRVQKGTELVVQRRQEIAGLLVEHGVKSHKFKDGVQVITFKKRFPQIKARDSTRFAEWLVENNLLKEIKLSPESLKALIQKRLEEGRSIPEYIETYDEDRLQVRGRGNQ